MNGDSEIVIAGGQRIDEHGAARPASAASEHQDGLSSGVVDTMIEDGLWDAFNGYHMGTTAENVAKAVSRIYPRAAGRIRRRLAEQS